MNKIIVLISLCFLLACSNKLATEKDYEWILIADPEMDAIVAARSGDKTLIGVSGIFGSEIPFENGYVCGKPKDVRYLKIDDVIDSYVEQKYTALAPIYAGSYNFYLWKYFSERGLDVCNS